MADIAAADPVPVAEAGKKPSASKKSRDKVFDFADGDIQLESSDNVLFRVHIQVMSASCRLFADMSEAATHSEDKIVVPFTSKPLRLLLGFAYPLAIKGLPGQISKYILLETIDLAETAAFFGQPVVSNLAREGINSFGALSRHSCKFGDWRRAFIFAFNHSPDEAALANLAALKLLDGYKVADEDETEGPHHYAMSRLASYSKARELANYRLFHLELSNSAPFDCVICGHPAGLLLNRVSAHLRDSPAMPFRDFSSEANLFRAQPRTVPSLGGGTTHYPGDSTVHCRYHGEWDWLNACKTLHRLAKARLPSNVFLLDGTHHGNNKKRAREELWQSPTQTVDCIGQEGSSWGLHSGQRRHGDGVRGKWVVLYQRL